MNTSKESLIINGQSIAPGQRATIMLPMPKLYDWTPLTMPVHIIRGRLPGPTLCVSAAIHGDEVNGIEIIRRLLKKSILKKLNGTLIAVPVLNVYGFLHQDRYLMDRRDLNRAFPGTKKGSLASRLAHLVVNELISKSTHCIDLHAGSHHRTNLPHIRVNLDMPGSGELAKSFHAPVILHATLRDGSMRQYANDSNIPFLLYEAGEALRFDELSIRTGVNGILGVMSALQMIPPLQKTITFKSTIARSSYWIRAPHSGILRPIKRLGKKIEKGDLLAYIANPTSTEEYKLYSPISGIIIGKNNLPMIHEGAALFHIACFEKLTLVAEEIEFLQESFGDSNDNRVQNT